MNGESEAQSLPLTRGDVKAFVVAVDTMRCWQRRFFAFANDKTSAGRAQCRRALEASKEWEARVDRLLPQIRRPLGLDEAKATDETTTAHQLPLVQPMRPPFEERGR